MARHQLEAHFPRWFYSQLGFSPSVVTSVLPRPRSPWVSEPKHRNAFNPTQAACCRSRLLALAPDEEGLHFLVLQNLHGRPLRSTALRDRKECLLRLRHHSAREVVLVDRVVLGRHRPVE